MASASPSVRPVEPGIAEHTERDRRDTEPASFTNAGGGRLAEAISGVIAPTSPSPTSTTLADGFTRIGGQHLVRLGGEVATR